MARTLENFEINLGGSRREMYVAIENFTVEQHEILV
jgi:hypothetical protein